MIVSTYIQKLSSKVWTDSFIAVNFHPHRCLSSSYIINNFALAVKMGDTYYFWKQGGSYYNVIIYVCKNMIVIKLGKLVSIIDCFVAENPDGKFPCRNIVCLSFVFYLDQITKIKIYHMIVIGHPKVIEGGEMVDCLFLNP